MYLCRLNILVVGGPSGFVELYAYGLYKIATLSGVGYSIFIYQNGMKKKKES